MSLKAPAGMVFPDEIMRKIYDHEKICFKKCIATPGKALSEEDEKCLNVCTNKVFKGLEQLRRKSDKKEAIIGSEPNL